MSNPRHNAESADQTEDMDIDSSELPADLDRHDLAIVSRDSPDWLSYIRALQETDIIILLTPVVIPRGQDTVVSDPFEPFGRALAKRHSRVRHVPYTTRNGITSTHLGFIKRGHVIILCFYVSPDRPLQNEIAETAFAVSDNKPCIIVVFRSSMDIQCIGPFPTMIHTTGYSVRTLEATAALIFGENLDLQGARPSGYSGAIPQQPGVWPVEQWDEVRDTSRVLDMWTECVSSRFAIQPQTLACLLRRPGYSKHYVVRDSSRGDILGFCATYLSYADRAGERLVASVALLFVQSANRHQGIGLSLHNHAINQLRTTRGVVRLQLGSTFPRILYGPPLGISLNEEWFRRRGWQLDRDYPGQGKIVHDLLLSFSDWRYEEDPFPPTTPSFRPCTQADMGQVLELVERTCLEQTKMGWFDQYATLMNGPNVKDVILGFADNAMVATALTYTPSCGSQISTNLPWAGQLGNDVGGVACICVHHIHPLLSQKIGFGAVFLSTLSRGLLDACVENLHNQGIKKMFIDEISEEVDTLLKLGFRKWAQYKDVWKDL
ncbi:hypothetical protein VTL71DRAFT_16065 [Oculimacula yallundae]|uniref:N-acetyltransferase domain-containing protein n=1 Tax=Oculimacula yallundae TaxID=86028 RepID=A0ABR4CEM5_9HELO